MKKLLLLALLVVGVYAQNDILILKDGKTHLIKYVETLPDGNIRIQIFNNGSILATSFDLNEIHSLTLEDGAIIINDGDLDGSAINSIIREKQNISQSSKLIRKSGFKLKKYKKEWATFWMMRFLGVSLIEYSMNTDIGEDERDILFYAGGIMGLIGFFGDLSSYNRIDEAGDALIEAGKELEKEQLQEVAN